MPNSIIEAFAVVQPEDTGSTYDLDAFVHAVGTTRARALARQQRNLVAALELAIERAANAAANRNGELDAAVNGGK
jgi:hypothetical protein